MTNIDEMIRQAQSGDRTAFESLVEMHYPVMFRFAMKYTGRREDAEDVTQQACIKLARFIGQYRFESKFSTWLYRLVINCGRDWHKSQRETGWAVEDPIEPSTPGQGEQQVLLHQVLRQVDDMGDGFRDAVVLVLGEGLSHRETADILESTTSTISWRLHEVRSRLRTLMAAEEDNE